MLLDRTISPKKHLIDNVDFLDAEIFTLSNGVKVYALKAEGQAILKTDIVLDAGSIKSDNPLIASAAANLLFTSANGRGAEEINEEFDFYGAFNSKSSYFKDCTITNYCLTKHSNSVYRLLSECIQNAEFDEHELEVYTFVKIQDLSIAKEKTSFLAKKAFNTAVFGNHPYGYNAEIEDYNALTTEQLSRFYHASKSIKYIIVSGAYTAETIQLLDTHFGKMGSAITTQTDIAITPGSNKTISIEKPGAMQSTIRMGFTTISRTHADYPALSVLVTLLGGFFGSRLMKNIREDKGYTYGIHAGLVSYVDCGLLFIQTDVKKEVYQSAIDEIFKEINRLKNEPVSDEELDVLANYSLGSFLRSIDGAFAISEKYKNLLDYGQDYNYYKAYLRLLKNLNKEILQETAQKYFVEENIYRVVAGV